MADVQTVLRMSGVSTMESGLESAMARSPCMARILCNHGAKTARTAKISNMKLFEIALNTFLELLKQVKLAYEPAMEAAVAVAAVGGEGGTRNVDALLGAHEVGMALGEEACANLYTCSMEQPQPLGRLSGPVSIADWDKPSRLAPPLSPVSFHLKT